MPQSYAQNETASSSTEFQTLHSKLYDARTYNAELVGRLLTLSNRLQGDYPQPEKINDNKPTERQPGFLTDMQIEVENLFSQNARLQDIVQKMEKII